MNDSIVKGKWTEFKGEVQQLWGKVTGEDLDRTQGNVKAIGGLLEQKYGQLKDDAVNTFHELVAKYRGNEDVRNAESAIADKTEQIKTSLQRDDETTH